MAEEDVELREAPNTSQSSVVDDFLAALFARPAPKEQEEKKNTTPSLDAPTITSNSTNQNVNTTAANNNTITTASTTDDEPLQQRPLTSEQQQQPSLQQPYSPTQTYQANERNIPKNNSNSGDGGNMGQAGVKRDRTPDEFDEYEMLSKRKHGSRAAHQESGNGNSSSSNSNAMLTSNMTLAANDASIARYSTMPVTSNIDNTISSRGDGNSRDAGGGMNRNRMSSTSFVGGRAPNVMTEDTSSHHHEGDRQNMNDTTIGSPRMGGMMMASSPSHNHHQRAPIQRNRDQVIPDARMVVRGLPHGSKKREILDYFSRYGPILDAYFKDTAGFIQFATRDACMDAYLSENGNYFRGSQLELSFSGPRRRDQKPPRRGGAGGSGGGNGIEDEYRTNATTTASFRGNRRFQNESNNRSTRKFDEYEPDRYRDNNSNNRRYKAYPSTSPTRANNSYPTSTNNNGYRNASPQRSHRFNTTDNYENVSNHSMDHYDGGRYATAASISTHGSVNDAGACINGGTGRGNTNNTMASGINGNSFGGNHNSNGNVLNRRIWRDEPMEKGPRAPLRANDHYQPPKHDAFRPNTASSIVSPSQQPLQQQSPAATRQASSSILSKRTGNDIPFVQIVAWDNVSSSYTDFIERSFRMQRISIHTLHLHYGQISREEVVSHLIMEGVRALLVVDNSKQAQGRIYLQVFEPNEEAGDGSVRFDEYDSISVEEAIAVMQRTVAQQQQQQGSYDSSSQSSVQPSRQNPTALQQAPYAAPPLSQVPTSAPVAAPPSMPVIDSNTLSSLITLVKGMMQQQQQQQQQQPPPPPAQQQQTYTPPVNLVPAPLPPQQPSYLSNPALANIPPALLNSPAVQQLLATMNQQQSPAVSSESMSRNTSDTSYSVPTTNSQTSSSIHPNNRAASSSYYTASSSEYSNNAYPQQQQQNANGTGYPPTSNSYSQQTYLTTSSPLSNMVNGNSGMNGRGVVGSSSSTSSYSVDKNENNSNKNNNVVAPAPSSSGTSVSTSPATANATTNSSSCSSTTSIPAPVAATQTTPSMNGNNNTLGNLPIGDILDKLQMFTKQQQQAPLPQRQ